jgi:hypothetical protein
MTDDDQKSSSDIKSDGTGLMRVDDMTPLSTEDLSKQPYLSKPASAIQVKVVQGKPTLLQAKISNSLLKVFQETPTETSSGYLTTRKWLSLSARYNSNDIHHLKKTADELTNIKIQFDTVTEDGIQTVGTTQMFSSIIFRSDGVVYFEMPEVTKKLMRRNDTRGFIHMTVAQLFDSLYAYRLYENCVVYRDVGQTKVWTLDELKDLLQIEDDYATYADFKHFNFKVIKPSINSVNKLSDIEVEAVYHRKGRSVASISFIVRPNKQYLLDFDAVDEFISLQDRIVAYGVKEEVAIKLAREYDKDRILRNLAYTIDRMHKGKVEDSAAFLIKAIQDDYAPKESEAEKRMRLTREAEEARIKKKELESKKRRESENEKIRESNEACFAIYESLDAEMQKALLKEFEGELREKNSPTLPLFKKKGLNSKIAKQEFISFLVLRGLSEPKRKK